jgi:hypothetical protein
MPPAPPAPNASGKIYMTPQLAKRRDGLCPSLLGDNHAGTIAPKPGVGNAAMIKSYQTNTRHLNPSIKDLENDSEELKYITDSIHSFLREIVDEKKQTTDLISLKFQPKGCTWTMELNPNHGAPNYVMQVVCLAKGAGNNTTTYMVDTLLVGKDAKSIASTTLPGFREAKATFESVGLVVRKAVVKCEFPAFPEGCKGRAFREVYQLNARVGSCVESPSVVQFHPSPHGSF